MLGATWRSQNRCESGGAPVGASGGAVLPGAVLPGGGFGGFGSGWNSKWRVVSFWRRNSPPCSAM